MATKKTTAATKTPAKKKAAPTKTAAKKTAAPTKTAAKKKSTTARPAAPGKSAPVKKAPAKKAAAPKKPKATDAGRILVDSVVHGILEKKGRNILCLDLRKLEHSVCDYFIICDADSTTQVDAIAQSVVDTVKKQTNARPYRSEGWQNSLWILIDYVNVIVHVFEKETRLFYNLESLWADAEEVKTGV